MHLKMQSQTLKVSMPKWGKAQIRNLNFYHQISVYAIGRMTSPRCKRTSKRISSSSNNSRPSSFNRRNNRINTLQMKHWWVHLQLIFTIMQDMVTRMAAQQDPSFFANQAARPQPAIPPMYQQQVVFVRKSEFLTVLVIIPVGLRQHVIHKSATGGAGPGEPVNRQRHHLLPQ